MSFGVGRMDWSPLAQIGENFRLANEQQRKLELGKLYAEAGARGDYGAMSRAAFGAGEVGTGLAALKLGIEARQNAQETQTASEVGQLLRGGVPGVSAPAPSRSVGGPPRADGTPINAPSFAGGQGGGGKRMPADPEIENRFVGALKAGGLTNPYGLAAVAAYANHESGYSPKNITGSWNDPSERGVAGQSGGILSWREGRLANMRRATAGAADPVVAQAQFTLTENPQLTMALQNAKSPEEANRLMANAWRFAGYDREGGEFGARLASTRRYVAKLGGAPAGGPTQVASIDPSIGLPSPGIPAAPPAQSLFGGRPQGVAPAPGLPMPPMPGSPADMAPVQVAQNGPQGPVPMPGAPQQAPSGPSAAEIRYNQLLAISTRQMPEGTRAGLNAELQRLSAQIAEERKPSQLQTVEDGRGGRAVFDPRTGQTRPLFSGPDKSRRDLTTEEKIARGLDPRTFAQVDANNEVYFPGKPATQINLGGDREFEKGSAGALVERFKSIGNAGEQARSNIPLLGEIRALGSSIGTGGFAALQAKLGEYGIKFEGSGKIEAYNALLDRLTPQQRVEGAGATSDFDARMFKGSLNRLVNTPEGNALISDTLEAVARDAVARGEIADRVLLGEENGGISRQEGLKQLRALPGVQGGFVARMKELAKAGKLPASPAPESPGLGPASAVAAPGFSEGATATNPSTGQKAVFQGGRWVPIAPAAPNPEGQPIL